ncbi:MAG: hypothetical protein NTZ27_12260 [Ignavibacteriales bacterium]|nr:hypothetical protein [Ignavibacteriales bacterium]
MKKELHLSGEVEKESLTEFVKQLMQFKVNYFFSAGLAASVPFLIALISTLLFFAAFSSLSFGTIGLLSKNHITENIISLKPFLT